MSNSPLPFPQTGRPPIRQSSRDLVRGLTANEIVFAVVGPVGSGTSEVANNLSTLLSKNGYETRILKAREVIEGWASRNSMPIQKTSKMDETTALQDAGDAMRERTGDNAAVALRLIGRIRRERAAQKGETPEEGVPVAPDDTKRAYILDSLRNPAEVVLLRSLYQETFCLVGIVCEEEARKERLRHKYRDAGDDKIERLMARDENAGEKHGQQVADTFHLADFFIDNTTRRFLPTAGGGQPKENEDWTVPEELGRLVDILTHSRVVRPRPSETGMFHAYGARMRSACLSRQVGAALMDRQGNVVATGTNEVPRAGGGVHGGQFSDVDDGDLAPSDDHRCALHGKFCRNTREQNDIIRDLLSRIDEFKTIAVTDDLIRRIRKTRIGQLIEFSRAVHAEMDALLSAARQGISPRGTRLFVTTFPCHNCARHIVAAGVDEVQFIEPYLKSKALPLHGDAITTARNDWSAPTLIAEARERTLTKDKGAARNKDMPLQVLFRPFTGVAPRLYRRAFYKDRDLKNNLTGDLLDKFGPSEGIGAPEALRVSYAQVEADLTAAAAEAEA